MINSKFLRRLFIPSASTFVVYAKDKGKDKDAKEEKLPAECEKLIKALELPLYKDNKESKGKSYEPKHSLNDDNFLVRTVRCMRQELKVFSDQFSIVRQQVAHVFLVAKEHTDSTISYLREPDNTYPRLGAITAGALTGYLLALRKGRFKKLVYMGAGAGAVAAVLYPDETKEFGEEGLKYMKRYVIIAYHFMNGDGARTINVISRSSDSEKKQYIPTALQQEYLDIQSKLGDIECVPKEPPPIDTSCLKRPIKPKVEPKPPAPPHPDKCKCAKERGVSEEDKILKGKCMTKKFTTDIP